MILSLPFFQLDKVGLVLFVFALLTVLLAEAQDRPAHWIHGLGDTSSVWRLYDPLFRGERRMNSNLVDYNTSFGVLISTRDASRVMPGDPNNYLIGHSMGGLVARQYEINNPGDANAILTIGTPHEGAWIANNILNGNARNALIFAEKELKAGPLYSGITPGSILYPIFGMNLTFSLLADLIFGNIADNLEETQVDSKRDLSVGSNYLATLNSTTRTVAMANIVCEENDRPGLRMAQAARKNHNPEDASLHSYDDAVMINLVEKLEIAYKVKRTYHEVLRFTNIFMYPYHNEAAKRWGRGEDYLDDKFDAEYNDLVGATRTETRSRTEWVQVCIGGDGCLDDMKRTTGIQLCKPSLDPVNCEWVQRTVYYTVTISEPSDGLVTAGSQHYDAVPVDRVYRAIGANHLEAGNHPEVTGRINDVFDRRTDDLGILVR